MSDAQKGHNETESTAVGAPPDDLPTAVLERDRRWSLTWVLPLLALLLVSYLGYQKIGRAHV